MPSYPTNLPSLNQYDVKWSFQGITSIQSLSRILVTTQSIIQSKSTVLTTVNVNVSSKCRIETVNLNNVSSSSRLWTNNINSINSNSRIVKSFLNSVNSKSSVLKSEVFNITSKALIGYRLMYPSLDSYTLISNIRALRSIGSKSWIIGVLKQNVSSKSSVLVSGYGNVSSKCNISATINNSISSKSRVGYSNRLPYLDKYDLVYLARIVNSVTNKTSVLKSFVSDSQSKSNVNSTLTSDVKSKGKIVYTIDSIARIVISPECIEYDKAPWTVYDGDFSYYDKCTSIIQSKARLVKSFIPDNISSWSRIVKDVRSDISSKSYVILEIRKDIGGFARIYGPPNEVVMRDRYPLFSFGVVERTRVVNVYDMDLKPKGASVLFNFSPQLPRVKNKLRVFQFDVTERYHPTVFKFTPWANKVVKLTPLRSHIFSMDLLLRVKEGDSIG